jgi:hypothetical protein
METVKMNIQKKISRARVELQKRKLKKTGVNKYSNYTYFELADFLPHINDICDELGLYCEFQFEQEKATLTIIDSDNIDSARSWNTPIEIAELKGCSAIQNIGGTQSYARRYLYVMAFEIAESDTIDGGEIDQDKILGKQKINKASVFTIKSLLSETNSNEAKFLEWAGVQKVEDITNEMLGTCLTKLNKIKEAMEKQKREAEKQKKEAAKVPEMPSDLL